MTPWVRTESRFTLPFPPDSAVTVLLVTLLLVLTVMVSVEVLWRRPARSPGALRAVLLAVLLLSLCETTLRVHLRMVEAGPYAYDQRREWRLQPNLHEQVMSSPSGPMPVSTNSMGLRDREVGPRAPGEVRILCLGDSWTFGHGVREEEAFARQLERLLKDAGPVRVLNAGQHGYSVMQAYALFEDLLPVYQPDVVLLCGFNEYSANGRDAETIVARPPDGLAGACIRMLSHSMLYLTLKKLVMDRRYAAAEPVADPNDRRGPPRFVSLGQTQASFQLFIDACRDRGTRLIMFDHAWPGQGEVGVATHPVLSRLEVSPGVWAVEVHPPSLSAGDPRFWVSAERTHPSPRGHREIAGILARFLQSQGCLRP